MTEGKILEACIRPTGFLRRLLRSLYHLLFFLSRTISDIIEEPLRSDVINSPLLKVMSPKKNSHSNNAVISIAVFA